MDKVNKDYKIPKRKKKKQLFNKGSVLGFSYTEEDELLIINACRSAEKWMKKEYGKGAQPSRLGVGEI